MTQLAFLPAVPRGGFAPRDCLPPASARVYGALWRCARAVPTPLPSKATTVDGGVTAARGFRAGGTTAGLKASGAPDLAVVVADGSAATAGAVFTRSRVRAAPVLVSQRHLRESGGSARAVVINAGQANAATGAAGLADAEQTAIVAAGLLGCENADVLLCSTGVIGVRIDKERLCKALPGALLGASATSASAADAAKAILTTDLRPKEVALERNIEGKIVRVGGMCKGSGMIHPDMATMLAVLTCDAEVEPDVWQGMVQRSADRSFNAITVDGDASTNDTVIALASGVSGLVVSDAASTTGCAVEELLTECMIGLAKRVARDGEGANVLVEVRVVGADSDVDARKVARTVAGSSLFKAAVFGCDPNWGRIAAAAGRAGVAFDAAVIDIAIGPHKLMSAGQPLQFDAIAASAYLKAKAAAPPDRYLSDDDTVVVQVGIGNGLGSGVAWGCDLSYKYVEINSEYST